MQPELWLLLAGHDGRAASRHQRCCIHTDVRGYQCARWRAAKEASPSVAVCSVATDLMSSPLASPLDADPAADQQHGIVRDPCCSHASCRSVFAATQIAYRGIELCCIRGSQKLAFGTKKAVFGVKKWIIAHFWEPDAADKYPKTNTFGTSRPPFHHQCCTNAAVPIQQPCCHAPVAQPRERCLAAKYELYCCSANCLLLLLAVLVQQRTARQQHTASWCFPEGTAVLHARQHHKPLPAAMSCQAAR